MYRSSSEIVKDSLTMPQVMEHYGVELRRGRRIPCPLHKGTDYNFIYDNKRFRCFVCGEHGTVIDFAMKLFDLDFKEALKKLDRDFGLGAIEAENSISAQERENAAQKRFREKQEKEQAKRYLTNLATFRRLVWEMYVTHKPSFPDEEPKPCFIYAAQNLDRIDSLIAELSEQERR